VLPYCGGSLLWGHSLGADVSAVRQIRGVARTLGFATLLLASSAQADGCRFLPIGEATVRAVTPDGIALEDGRTVRLAGIELGSAPDLPAGITIRLKRLGAETDRYGRLAAHVFIPEGGDERWLQADLVAQGFARVARVGDPACAKLLLAKEESARTARVGLWGEAVYVVGKAEDPAGILKGRGRFALIEGKIVSVRESGGTIYVNFGRRWSEDFTVTIAKRNERHFTAAGLAPKSLSGRRVRIRGWIEERGGPWVEAARPEQIEILNDQVGGRL
jgi:endonuclease YncB( thermonuclease family)